MIEFVCSCREKQNGCEKNRVSQISRGGPCFLIRRHAVFRGLCPLFLHLVGKPRMVKLGDKRMRRGLTVLKWFLSHPSIVSSAQLSAQPRFIKVDYLVFPGELGMK